MRICYVEFFSDLIFRIVENFVVRYFVSIFDLDILQVRAQRATRLIISHISELEILQDVCISQICWLGRSELGPHFFIRSFVLSHLSKLCVFISNSSSHLLRSKRSHSKVYCISAILSTVFLPVSVLYFFQQQQQQASCEVQAEQMSAQLESVLPAFPHSPPLFCPPRPVTNPSCPRFYTITRG